jgi:hypothetical protein
MIKYLFTILLATLLSSFNLEGNLKKFQSIDEVVFAEETAQLELARVVTQISIFAFSDLEDQNSPKIAEYFLAGFDFSNRCTKETTATPVEGTFDQKSDETAFLAGIQFAKGMNTIEMNNPYITNSFVRSCIINSFNKVPLPPISRNVYTHFEDLLLGFKIAVDIQD